MLKCYGMKILQLFRIKDYFRLTVRFQGIEKKFLMTLF